jgi:hypothetical protein
MLSILEQDAKHVSGRSRSLIGEPGPNRQLQWAPHGASTEVLLCR